MTRFGRVAALLVTAAAVLLPASAALASPSPSGVAAPESAERTATIHSTFGALLDWTHDNAQNYAKRLGGTAGLYGQTLGYPLERADRYDVQTVAEAASAQGAKLYLELRPRRALDTLTGNDASELADELNALHKQLGVDVDVDFAPEMNATWTAWGQQPTAYIAAYRTVARIVHADAPSAEMVWSPANGAGYPFRGIRGEVDPSAPRASSLLDTNGDGRLDAGDDPYRPYWPGAAYVDRVALSVYWFGLQGGVVTNSVPSAGWLAASLHGRVGYATPSGPDRDFVRIYSQDTGKPMLLETAAAYLPAARSGASRAAIVTGWLGQVFSPAFRKNFPTIDNVLWLEHRGPDAEAGGTDVDWRATSEPALATALHADLIAQHYSLGPVPSVGGRAQADAAVPQVYDVPGVDGSGADGLVSSERAGSDRILIGVGVLLGLILIGGVVARVRPAWGYRTRGKASSTRDDRIDMLRGFVMTLVIVTHIELAGPWTWLSSRIGALSGAEMFVLLAGVVMGALYPLTVARFGELAAASAALRRAAAQYGKTIAVLLTVFFMSLIPFVNTTSITTFTDRGTGSAGPAAAGRVYDLLGTSHHLLDYPPPEYAVRDLFLLRWGPWPINIMGLFVVLSIAAPAAMWLVRRRLWWVLLAISWGLWIFDRTHRSFTLFDAQFEAVFPLLAWQIAFTHGLVIGYYRTQIYRALTSRIGKVMMVGVPAAVISVLLVLRAGVHVAGLPRYDLVYTMLYQRLYLDPGRLLDLTLFLVATYAFMTTCWRPVRAVLGGLLLPLGRMSLRVFFIQVFLVLAVSWIPGLDRTSWWQGALLHPAAIGVAWLLVRDRTKRPAAPAKPAATAAAKPLAAAAAR